MGAFFGLAEFVARSAENDLMSVCHKCFEQLFQIECFRTSVDQSDIVDAERGLESRHLVELGEHNLGVRVALDVDLDTDDTACRRIFDIGDAVDLLLLDKVSDALHKLVLENAVGDFREVRGVSARLKGGAVYRSGQKGAFWTYAEDEK